MWNGNAHWRDSLNDEDIKCDQCSLRSHYYSVLGLRNSQLAAAVVNSDLRCFQSSDSDSSRESREIEKESGTYLGASYCGSECDRIVTDFESSNSDKIEEDKLSYTQKIGGLGCSGSSVRNLSFFYMDSNKHWAYANALAVDGKLEPRIAVTIADTQVYQYSLPTLMLHVFFILILQNRSQFVYNESQQISEEATGLVSLLLILKYSF